MPESTWDAPDTPEHGLKLHGRLDQSEHFWRDHYQWLFEQGYELRSRYRPNWKPSWKGTKKPWDECTDGLYPLHNSAIDAQRRSDGELLMLKRTKKSLFPHETEIGLFFSTEPISGDPRNHCIPIYDILQVPDDDEIQIVVMPMLRVHDDPRFDTTGEAVEFFRQMFEGLQFMHSHNVAHRDVTFFNVMMDARELYIDRYHPCRPWRKLDLSANARHYTRTQKPVKYYLTDFGLSRKYKPEERPPQEPIIRGADKSAPEYKTTDACDPFPTDVYLLGNLIRENFTEGSRFASKRLGFQFMKPLVADMTHDDPSKRPSMDEVVERFEIIRKALSSSKLRARVVKAKDSPIAGFFRALSYWHRRVDFAVHGTPPIPTPPSPCSVL
ncbi:hypothetical protein CCMSSC00406_0003772 [Pleurotus cornucopiae]|uniref:Uncharacterized protein n=1 Tax=Pleurotus cornucopiae TaxID=5321 RepID=A0ACB7IR03_PLECO|nr:hypothetical protein CCMSSC00406_0003772 [Pleurotus cornucopiae]